MNFHRQGKYNLAQYPGSDKLDALLDQGRQVRDPVKLAQIYSEAWQIISDDQPWTPLVYQPNVWGLRANVEGFVLEPERFPYFDTCWFSK